MLFLLLIALININGQANSRLRMFGISFMNQAVCENTTAVVHAWRGSNDRQ